MTELTLHRTGFPPLRFNGDLIAFATSQVEHGRTKRRFHEIRLYDTDDGRRVVEVEYISTWKRPEPGHRWAVACEHSAVPAALAAHDPVAYVVGYPPIEQFVGNQEKLLAGIRLGYQEAVSAVLEMAGYVEEA